MGEAECILEVFASAGGQNTGGGAVDELAARAQAVVVCGGAAVIVGVQCARHGTGCKR